MERVYYVLFLERFDTNVLELETYGFQLEGRLKDWLILRWHIIRVFTDNQSKRKLVKDLVSFIRAKESNQQLPEHGDLKVSRLISDIKGYI